MDKHQEISVWKVEKTQIVHKTEWIKITKDSCVLRGKRFVYTYVSRIDEGPLIIPREKNGSLWLVRQYRHPVKKMIWQFPVEGKLPNESWRTAAKRGLFEELGLIADTYHRLGNFLVDPGGSDQKYQIFLATNLSPAQHAHGNEEIEELEKKLFTQLEIGQMIILGEICDNWTLSALHILERHQLAKKSNNFNNID